MLTPFSAFHLDHGTKKIQTGGEAPGRGKIMAKNEVKYEMEILNYDNTLHNVNISISVDPPTVSGLVHRRLLESNAFYVGTVMLDLLLHWFNIYSNQVRLIRWSVKVS